MQLKVKQLLKEKGLRMTDLAAKLDVDQSNLSKSLDGNPTISRLEDIAAAIGVPVRELLPDAPPTNPVGILSMDNKRFALVPLPEGTIQEPKPLLEVPELSPRALQEKIYSLAKQSAEDGKTRAVYGFLRGHLVVVLHDAASKRYLLLFWDTDGDILIQDYPSSYGDDGEVREWEYIQLAEFIVNEIISNCDL